MPNWVKNIVTVSENTMNKIKEKYIDGQSLSFEKIIPMPKTLNLVEGSVTEKAIYYAWLQKDSKGKQEIRDILENYNTYFYPNYWEKIKEYERKGNFREIEKYAENYELSNIEKELNINSLEGLGDTYINNIKHYRATTWYEWCIENWGTKWEPSNISFDNNKIIFETAWSIPDPIFKELSKEFPNDTIEVRFADEDISSDNNGIITYKNGLSDISMDLGEKFAINIWNETIEKDKDITDEIFE